MTRLARGVEAIAELVFVLIVGYGIATGRLDATLGIWSAGAVLGGPAVVRAILGTHNATDTADSDDHDRRPPRGP